MIGASRLLFVMSGAFWLIIGVLMALLLDRNIGQPMVFASPSADAQLFGASAGQVLKENTGLFLLRYAALRTIAGLLVGAGLLVIGLAWFGLKTPETWALGILTVAGIAVIPYWWISFGQYRAAGVDLGLFDIPPFMWVPAVLMITGSVLGWIGSASSS